jgi:hypothetical protein
MIVTIDPGQISAMKKAIENTGRTLRKELAVACNATAAKSKSIIAKQIGNELAVPQKIIKTTISQSKKANESNITATVEVRKDRRISLKEFGARQTKAGVSYKISKTRGRKSIPGAFQGPRPGRINVKTKGNVFKRVGKSRLPIVKLYGPSSWGVFVVGKKQGPSVTEIEAELKKQIDRRIRFIALKASGAI